MSANAEMAALIWFQVGNFTATKVNFTDLGMVAPGNAVEHRGFSRSVRPDDGKKLTSFDVKADPLQGLDTTEGEGDVLYL